MRIPKTESKFDAWVNDHWESFVGVQFLGFAGGAPSFCVVATHMEYDYGMPWPAPWVLGISLVLFFVSWVVRYARTLHVNHVVKIEGHTWEGEAYGVSMDDMYAWRAQIQSPSVKALADDLVLEMERAYRAIGATAISDEEKSAMESRHSAMKTLFEHEKTIVHEGRRLRTMELDAVEKVEAHLGASNQLTTGN